MSVKAYIKSDLAPVHPVISGRASRQFDSVIYGKDSRQFDSVIYGKGRKISYQEHTKIANRTPGMKRA